MTDELGTDVPQQETLPPPPPATPAPPAPPNPVVAPRLKSPGLAVVFSFFPGLGHLYLGLYQRAVIFFGCLFLAIYLSDRGGEVGMLIPFIWFFAIFDAYRQAQIINSQEAIMPETTAPGKRRGGLGLGVFLVVVGGVLLIDKFYPIDFSWLGTWWPVILIGVGLWLILSFYQERQKERHSFDDDLYGEE